MNSIKSSLLQTASTALLVVAVGISTPAHANLPVAQTPLSVGSSQSAPPLNMLVMGRDHKLYYEAYNDASDLNGDGVLDVGYKGYLPANQGGMDYFGYFDSHRCYSYNTSGRKFSPGAAAPNKTCSNAWSGDFLNYLTTSRMDAMRKVLYGGYRVVDTETVTTLERAYIPQDAHTWGKEYTSLAVDGYQISSYAPLTQPDSGKRHLFANVTLRNSESLGPLLRLATNSDRRIWNWVAKENPVAGDSCSGGPCAGVTGSHPGHPRSRAEFDTLETNYAIPDNLQGTSSFDRIDCNGNNCNPHGTDDNYLTIITGNIVIRQQGTYVFHIDGDDNIDFIMRDQAGNIVASTGCYPNGRGFGGACNPVAPSVTANNLPVGTYSFKFRHEEAGGGDGYRLSWERTDNSTFSTTVLRVVDQHAVANANASGGFAENPSFSFYTLIPGSTIRNLRVRVDVCVAGALESNCKQYGGNNGPYKPTGILHDYGEADRMMFGLLTGSYAKNTQGGVLRKNVSSFKDEVDPDTGQFTDIVGIVKTIDRLRTIDFNAYSYTCGWIATRPIDDGECSMWGNPVAEMMYETLRYLGGASAPRSEFAIADDAKDTQTPLELPMPDWKPPYASEDDGGSGYLRCATPVMTVISDINPSYDGSVPGSNWDSISASSDPAPIDTLDVSTQVNAIWSLEGGGPHNIFIGESGGVKDSNPTVKSVSNLSTVRGLAPEEPSKEGTYYSAGVARFGAANRIGGEKNAMTYAVALASPLPRLEFPVGNKTITVVPFAKSVGEYGIDGTGDFQPTNQIVDFFVQKIANTDPDGRDSDPINNGLPYAEFRINYEDVEQGADHDMDAIALYTLQVTSNGELEISLNSEYASGSIVQYMGYIISGTTKDGIYLEVSDCDTKSSYPSNTYCDAATGYDAYRYKLNTPPGEDANYCADPANLASADCFSLPYSTSRTFVPGNTPGAQLLNGPLWYAAKYGRPTSFDWDEDGNQEPDNYFLVTNAGTLKAQLDKAFSQIIADTQNSGGVAASGARANEGFMAYVPEFTTTDWTGDLRAHKINPATGTLLPAIWRAGTKLAELQNTDVVMQSKRKLYYVDPTAAPGARQQEFTVTGLGATPAAAAAKLGISDTIVDDVVDYLRGDHSKEQRNGGAFRNRSSRIGDIFSQPAVLDKASHGYLNLPAPQGGYGPGGYAEFVADKEDRTPVVFVSANDGFIHAFDATDDATAGGQELFAIAPASVLQNMGQLASPGYTHRYYVNESPIQGDAYIGGGWKTVVLAATGAGGRSIVALDATSPSLPANNGAQVLWEYSNTSSGGADLGLTIGTPKIALLPSGQWAAIFGNGYNSDNHKAFLYIVNLETGALIAKVATGNEGTVDAPNGLASPAIIDLDGNGVTDLIYAGDYRGNLWRIPLTASGNTLNTSAATRLFTAEDTANGDRQHITGGVTASIHPSGGQLVFFGTGSYFLDGDNAPTSDSDQVQTFYGIWDENNGHSVDRDDLQAQQFTASGTGRTTTSDMVDWGTQKGWYIDLKADGEAADGERFIGQPTVVLGNVQFWTFVSEGDECEPGGFNWNNMLSATTGSGSLGAGMGGTGSAGSNRPPGSEGQPITSRATIVTVRSGGDAGTEDCDPSDPGCTPPAPSTDSDGNPLDLGQVQPQGCVVTVNLLTAVGLDPQARLGCGRLSWRQMQ